MLMAQEKLRPLVTIPPSGKSWREDPDSFRPGEGPQGSVNLLPAWFQQGHDVSASMHKLYFLGSSFQISECRNNTHGVL